MIVCEAAVIAMAIILAVAGLVLYVIPRRWLGLERDED